MAKSKMLAGLPACTLVSFFIFVLEGFEFLTEKIFFLVKH